MRRSAAGLLGAWWAFATLGLPALHLLDHAEDHLHIGGAIVWVGGEEQPHHHDDSEYDRYFDEDFDWDEEPSDPQDSERDSRSSTPAGELPPFAHGQSSASHLGLSAIEAAEAAQLDCARAVTIARALPPSSPLSRDLPKNARARAPPV